MTNPRRGGELGGRSGQPGVRRIVGRTRLSGELATTRQSRSRVVLASRLRQGCCDLLGDLRIDDLLAVCRTFLKNVLLAVSDLRDRIGLAHLAIVDEGRESTSHGQRRSRTRTQDVTGNGQDRFAVSVINTHIGRYLEDIAEVELGGHVDEGVVHRKAGCADDIESTVLARQVDDVPAFSVDGLAITLK